MDDSTNPQPDIKGPYWLLTIIGAPKGKAGFLAGRVGKDPCLYVFTSQETAARFVATTGKGNYEPRLIARRVTFVAILEEFHAAGYKLVCFDPLGNARTALIKDAINDLFGRPR